MRSKSMIKVKPFRIHAEFENNTKLKCALNLIAEKLKLELYWSEGWDLVAMHFDIAIIDRKVINREAWEYYLNENMGNRFENECIILVDNLKPASTPPFYTINQFDPNIQEGIRSIIKVIRESVSLKERDFLRLKSAVRKLEDIHLIFSREGNDVIQDGIMQSNIYEHKIEPNILWILPQFAGTKKEADILFNSDFKDTIPNHMWKQPWKLMYDISFGGFLTDSNGKLKEKIPTVESFRNAIKNTVFIDKRIKPDKIENEELQQIYECDKDIIAKQIRAIEPDIIIGQDSLFPFESIFADCPKSIISFRHLDRIENRHCYFHNSIIWIDAPSFCGDEIIPSNLRKAIYNIIYKYFPEPVSEGGNTLFAEDEEGYILIDSKYTPSFMNHSPKDWLSKIRNGGIEERIRLQKLLAYKAKKTELPDLLLYEEYDDGVRLIRPTKML